MSIFYFRKSSENTQSLFSLMQGLLALPGERDFKLGPEQRTASGVSRDLVTGKQGTQAQGILGSMEANYCNQNLTKVWILKMKIKGIIPQKLKWVGSLVKYYYEPQIIRKHFQMTG